MADQQRDDLRLYTTFSAGNEVVALTPEERYLLRAYRMASPDLRDAMLCGANVAVKFRAKLQPVERFDNVTAIGFVVP